MRKTSEKTGSLAARHLPSPLASIKESPAMLRAINTDAGLDKLQEFLLAMSPGDEVSVARAAELSGLDRKRCDAVLSALMRAGVMMRLQHDAYVRCRLQAVQQRTA
jgi:predicted transcriptional regulator of viral defense system